MSAARFLELVRARFGPAHAPALRNRSALGARKQTCRLFPRSSCFVSVLLCSTCSQPDGALVAHSGGPWPRPSRCHRRRARSVKRPHYFVVCEGIGYHIRERLRKQRGKASCGIAYTQRGYLNAPHGGQCTGAASRAAGFDGTAFRVVERPDLFPPPPPDATAVAAPSPAGVTPAPSPGGANTGGAPDHSSGDVLGPIASVDTASGHSPLGTAGPTASRP